MGNNENKAGNSVTDKIKPNAAPTATVFAISL